MKAGRLPTYKLLLLAWLLLVAARAAADITDAAAAGCCWAALMRLGMVPWPKLAAEVTLQRHTIMVLMNCSSAVDKHV